MRVVILVMGIFAGYIPCGDFLLLLHVRPVGVEEGLETVRVLRLQGLVEEVPLDEDGSFGNGLSSVAAKVEVVVSLLVGVLDAKD